MVARRSLPASRASLVLVGMVLLFFVFGEFICRLAIPRLVSIEGRREQEYRQAVLMRAEVGKLPQVLVLGNSLLAEGVDFDAMKEKVADSMVVRRLMIESTSYFDWLFGLRRLMAEGSRPVVFVLVLSPDQLISNAYRGDYSAYRLLRTADARLAGRTIGLTNTQTADLVLSSMSALLGMRTNIRKRVMLSAIPGIDRLMHIMTARDEPRLDPEIVRGVAEQRLRQLRATSAPQGRRIVLVVPPTNDQDSGALTAAVAEAGIAADVAVIVPVVPGTLPAGSFLPDGYHLSKIGSAIFTPRFADELRRLASD